MGKLYFLLLKSVKLQKGPLGQSVSGFSAFYKMKLDTILSTLNRICVPGGVKGQMNDPQ